MPSRPNRRNPSRRRKQRRRRSRWITLWRILRTRWKTSRKVLKAVLASPPTVRAFLIVSGSLLLWLSLNWAYHAYSKPSEILFPLDHSLNKAPSQTWQEYGELFREHSTAVITPELLAALAQSEGAGNPVARTYWRWRVSWNPLEWYQPASSAVGMYQLTDGTFQLARRYCIHDHEVIEDGPWSNLQSCWFNSFYSRIVPSHAIEMTAALLDRSVASAMGHRRAAGATLQKKQDLAAIIHLCGAGAGKDYARRGFRLLPHQRCGDHDVRTYLGRINELKRQFSTLATGGKTFRQAR